MISVLKWKVKGAEFYKDVNGLFCIHIFKVCSCDCRESSGYGQERQEKRNLTDDITSEPEVHGHGECVKPYWQMIDNTFGLTDRNIIKLFLVFLQKKYLQLFFSVLDIFLKRYIIIWYIRRIL